MLINMNNMQRDSAAYNANAPFSGSGELYIGDMAVPSGSLLSLKVYCDESVTLPVRLASIARDTARRTSVRLTFLDALGYTVGYCTLEKTAEDSSRGIFNSEGYLCGHMYYTKEFADICVTAVQKAPSGVSLDSDAFQLLPQNHVATLTGKVKSIYVGGSRISGNVVLHGGEYTRIDNASGAISMGVVGAYQESTYNNRLCVLKLPGQEVDIKDAHLILRHTPTSNIRVTGADSEIILTTPTND